MLPVLRSIFHQLLRGVARCPTKNSLLRFCAVQSAASTTSYLMQNPMLVRAEMISRRVFPSLIDNSPGTFSSSRCCGRFAPIILTISRKYSPLGSSRPRRFPAPLNGWQGNPATKRSWSGTSLTSSVRASRMDCNLWEILSVNISCRLIEFTCSHYRVTPVHTCHFESCDSRKHGKNSHTIRHSPFSFLDTCVKLQIV